VEVVRDWKTGQSLQYGFIEFDNITSCEEAYIKMNNVIIDDRRIQVDFSQSVSKLLHRNHKATLMNSQPVKYG
jgi:peptidyl-prolyl cis-trans isomerase-like 4